jgi:hypothetical protein
MVIVPTDPGEAITAMPIASQWHVGLYQGELEQLRAQAAARAAA